MIQQSASIAVAFSVLAISTSVLLVVPANIPVFVHWLFAVFWLITGLLGLFIAFQSRRI